METEYRVKELSGLHVVDFSVVPTPIGAHYMDMACALAEQMAEIVIDKNET